MAVYKESPGGGMIGGAYVPPGSFGTGGTSTTDYTIPPFPGTEGEKSKTTLAADYKVFLQNLGIKLTPNLETLIDQAVRRSYNADEFLFYLRQTPEYHQAFPGIPKGMTESTYMSYKSQYEGIAAQVGLDINDAQIGWLFRNKISPDVYGARAEGVQRIDTNPALAKQFQQVTGENPDKINLLRFVMGEGNKEWYTEWNKVVARYQAVEAGLRLGERAKGAYVSLPGRLLKEVVSKGFSESDLRSGFAELADLFAQVRPESLARNMGLSKKELERSVFGGKGSAEARAEVARLMKAMQDTTAPGQMAFGTLEGGAGTAGERRAQRAQVQ